MKAPLLLLAVALACSTAEARPPGPRASGAASRLRDKYRGAVLGSYLGDAIGKGVEFRYAGAPEEAPRAYRLRRVRRFAERTMFHLEGRERNQPIGTYTDDTEEAIAVLDALVSNKGRFDVNVLAGKLLHHFHPSHGYSKSTQALLESFRRKAGARGYDALGRRDRFFLRMPSKRYRDSNGCSMRSAAMGLKLASLAIEDDADFRAKAYRSCELTHPAPSSMEGAALVMKAIEYALKRAPGQFRGLELLDLLVAFNRSARPRIMAGTPAGDRKKVIAAFDRLRANLSKVRAFHKQNARRRGRAFRARELKFLREEIGVGVENSTSVPAALYLAARYHGSYRAAIHATLHVSLAGDTDTLPAMVGAIIGALHGAAAIPRSWRDQLYTGDARWRKLARYRRDFHEPLLRADGRPRYLSWKEVVKLADRLHGQIAGSGVGF
jgi:ADP-ribosylglycohydrolase